MSDSIIDQIKAAQAGPAENYMVWAEIGRGEKVEEVLLHSVRLPQSIGADEVLSYPQAIRNDARRLWIFGGRDCTGKASHHAHTPG